jgi:formate transporter
LFDELLTTGARFTRASGCSSFAGKMTAVWFPISAFIALGLDHSVANMFIIPLGMFIGGALCVMGPFGVTMGNWMKKDKKA